MAGGGSDEARTIGELADGDRARVRGTVARARSDRLRSALGEVDCVYWDVREGLDAAPKERGAQEFWIEDESGRALVRPEALHVDARASRQEELVAAAEADYQAISERLRALKDQLRAVGGDRASELVKKRKRLAKVATLICAIKAHARGRKHLGGSLEGQARWIDKHASLVDAEDGVRAAELMVSRWETVICEGQTIEVDATFRIEPMPPGVGGGGGYRERPTCLVAGPRPDGVVEITGVGAAAPQSAADRRSSDELERGGSEDEAPLGEAAGGRRIDARFERAVVTVLIVIAFVATMVWLLRR